MSKRDPNMRKMSFLGLARRTSEGHGGTSGPGGSDEVQLDDEMDKVFAMADSSSDKFDVAQLSASSDVDASISNKQFGEKDYSFHRKKSYPHTHTPLKAMNPRNVRRRVSESEASEAVDGVLQIAALNGEVTALNGDVTAPVSTEALGQDNQDNQQEDDTLDDSAVLSSESEAQVSERAASYSTDSPVFGSPQESRRVQFTRQTTGIDDIPEDVIDQEEDRSRRKSSTRHHSHHHKYRKYSLQEDPEWRKRSGSERPESSGAGRRVSVQPEDTLLEEADLEDLTAHRSDQRNHRRHKVGASKSSTSGFVRIGRKEGEHLQNLLPLGTFKKMYDHSPHEVFVQLDELIGVGEDREWKETARWIKYEEDVEEGSDRWGRPHVASLSFHSLLNLRRCLETGVVLLDLEEKDLPGVAYRVVEQMVIEELIHEDDKAVIMRALLLRHRHVNEHDRGFHFGPRRKYSSYTSLQNLAENEKGKSRNVPSSTITMESITKNGNGVGIDGRITFPETHIDIKEETYSSSQEDLKKSRNETIFKRIPVGAEATTVLVGAVEFLEQPTIAFIRLAEGILIPSVTEVPIPVRFLFILLGPKNADLDYHEVGRSIATLMANQSFHQIAYKADDRKELLSAINEFLDDSIVLPPGDWERQALLPFDELKAKSDMIRSRKNRAIQEKNRTPEKDDDERQLLSAALGGTSGDDKKPPPNPLERTRKPFGGLINDLKRRYPYYKSDILEGFNSECLAATIFMYFAALSTAVTFGGLMSDKTHNLIGISETLVATSVTGVLFAMFAGQPLVIIGTTGPLLLFDESLFQFCMSNDIDFLTTRLYIGLWLAIIALTVASVEGSVLVKLFSRFTEEIFSSLISLLYIVESVQKLFFVFGRHPILADYCAEVISSSGEAVMMPDNNSTNTTDFFNDTDILHWTNSFDSSELGSSLPQEDAIGPINQPNTALFCAILALGTFAIAYYLRLFRNSHFFGRNARRALGDFGVPIAIVIMVAFDYVIPQTYTEKLSVPDGLTPSDPSRRGWVISPTGSTEKPFPVWVGFAAVIPAMLVYILLFMETHISELIIDKPERNLRKGSGFHMDIVLICLLNIGCGLLGAPWHCAATVRSVTHVSAVTIMSRTHAPGEKPHIIEVKEQRVSGFFVAILVGASVMMAPLLRLVPLSVLVGVFLYMGVASTSGIQFFDRIKLFFMPVKHHPQMPYVRRVQTYKMHLFTLIQLVALAMLWTVKSTQASLAFPFFLIMMVPIRQKMAHFFTPSELRALDGNQPDARVEDEPDFYEQAPLPG